MEVSFSQSAERDLGRLTKSVAMRVFDKIKWLVENFESADLLSLGGQLSGFYKLRVGDWRVIYKVDWMKDVITIVAIDHRSKVYK
jgi:mRNA interferase RelE/StbE